uniref:B cell scaffold protein with ankyrin repeats 1 n=1 Tax=Varanus komodoensis TaxID=61221 RepID=A0A8D2KZ05_VARKO
MGHNMISSTGPHGSLSMGLRSELKLADRRVETEKSPEEIFILLRDEVPDDSVVVEFITENDWIRTEPEIWNQKVRCMKALEFPAGFVNVNVYCEGVIKATTQIEYYTTIGEIDRMLQKVINKLSTLTYMLLFHAPNVAISQSFKNCVCLHTDSHLEELPTLLHCAAKFGFRELATLLLQCPEAIQACKVANKNGENPAQLAKKYGRNEIWKIIQELPVSVSTFTYDVNCYHVSNSFLRNSQCSSYRVQHSATLGNYHKEESSPYCPPPSLPPRTSDEGARLIHFGSDALLGIACLAMMHQGSDESLLKLMAKETKETNGDQKEDDEAEDPYTSAMEDNGIYDMILTNAIKERKKESRSFIMNRPPAPAPRPSAVPMKEENTPYIAQVFQQKVTRNKAGDEKLLYAVRKPGMELTSSPSIPLGQEELILLQEQVKRGTISMDEAVEKFKQWQVHKKGLEATQDDPHYDPMTPGGGGHCWALPEHKIKRNSNNITPPAIR